jgi:hypothetical protein
VKAGAVSFLTGLAGALAVVFAVIAGISAGDSHWRGCTGWAVLALAAGVCSLAAYRARGRV